MLSSFRNPRHQEDPLQYAAELKRALERASIPDLFTTTEFTDAGSTLNTQIKQEGLMVWNTTTKRPLWAKGPAPTDAWVDHAGTTVFTPA